MKKLIPFFLAFLLINGFCYSQDTALSRSASFKKYGQYIQPYLKSVHESTYKGQLDSFKNHFLYIISFRIDSNGKIVEYDCSKKEEIPIVVYEYVKSIIYMTSGGWSPEIKNCELVKSEKIQCQVSISPKNFFFSKLKEIKKSDEDLKLHITEEFNFEKPNRCFLHLNY